MKRLITCITVLTCTTCTFYASDWRCTRPLTSPAGKFTHAKFASDETKLIAITKKDTIAESIVHVLDASTGKSLLTLEGNADSAVATFESGQTSQTEVEDISGVKFLDALAYRIANRHNVATFGPDDMRTFRFSNIRHWQVREPSDSSLIGVVQMYDIRTKKTTKELRGHHDIVHDASFSDDGKFVITSSADCTSRIWNTSTGECLRTLNDNYPLHSARLSPDNRLAITIGSAAATAKMWDTATGECVDVLKISDVKTHRSAEFSPSGTRIVILSQEDKLYLFKNGKLRAERDATRLAFASVLHQRLGEKSPANVLSQPLVQQICSLVTGS